MSSVVIYTTRFCPFCIRAKQLLKELMKGSNIQYKEIAVDNNRKLRQEMTKKSGRHTVPQIWINHQHIGGCDDLFELKHSGELTRLLSKA